MKLGEIVIWYGHPWGGILMRECPYTVYMCPVSLDVSWKWGGTSHVSVAAMQCAGSYHLPRMWGQSQLWAGLPSCSLASPHYQGQGCLPSCRTEAIKSGPNWFHSFKCVLSPLPVLSFCPREEKKQKHLHLKTPPSSSSPQSLLILLV